MSKVGGSWLVFLGVVGVTRVWLGLRDNQGAKVEVFE